MPLVLGIPFTRKDWSSRPFRGAATLFAVISSAELRLSPATGLSIVKSSQLPVSRMAAPDTSDWDPDSRRFALRHRRAESELETARATGWDGGIVLVSQPEKNVPL